MEQRLIDAGYDSNDVNELLYDPAPRRRGKISCSARQRATMPQICKGSGGGSRRRTYDPAPRRRVTAKRTGKKGTMSKLGKFALPGAAGLTFYGAYLKRAEDLSAAGKIAEKSVFQAIEYDMKNFDGEAAMKRVQEQAGTIIAPLIGGWAIKETKVLGKYSGIAGDILAGLGIGIGAKAVLDPPIAGSGKTRTRTSNVSSNGSIMASSIGSNENHIAAPCPSCYNPYMPGGY